MTPSGEAIYKVERNTVVLGERRRQAGPGLYRAVAHELADFRPADGSTTTLPCDASITDTSRYTISWTDGAGRETQATHQTGCAGGPGKAFDVLLRATPARLGIAPRAKQTTQPCSSRG